MRAAPLLAAVLLLVFVSASAAPPATPPQCLKQAADHYGVSWQILMAIRDVEGGWPGARVRNANGTFDHGVMQINSVNTRSPELRASGITELAIQNSECVAYWVAAWIYKREVQGAGGDAWRGAGNYHSKTPIHHERYLRKLRAAYTKRFGTDLVDGPGHAKSDADWERRCREPTSDDALVCEAWSIARELDHQIAELRLSESGPLPEDDADMDALVELRLRALDTSSPTGVR